MSLCCKKSGSNDSIESYGHGQTTSEASPKKKGSLSSCCSKTSKEPEDSCEIPASNSARPSKSNSFCFSSCFKSTDSKYTTTLEKEYETLQMAFFALTSHFAKVQFRLRQIIQAEPSERDRLLIELATVAFCGIEEFKCPNMPRMEKDLICLGNIRRRQGCLIGRLRGQMEYLCEHSVPCEPEPVEKFVTINEDPQEEEKDNKQKKDKKK